MHLVADLPPIPAADRALALVRAGEATGLSLEFHSEVEKMDGEIRVLEVARVSGIGLVRAPSYDSSRVEARARGGRGGRGRPKERREWIKGGIRYGVTSYCQCLRGECNKILFRPTAFGYVDDGDDVLAHVGRTTESVGSTRGKTLRLTDTPDALEFLITDAARDTAAGRQLTDLARAKTSIFGRPLLDDAASEFTEEAGVRTYTKAKMRGLLLKPIGGSPELREGWDPIELLDEADPPPPSPCKEVVMTDGGGFVGGTALGARAAVDPPGPSGALTASELAAAARISEDLAARLLPVARQLVEDYAIEAPLAIHSEAEIRTAGWLSALPQRLRSITLDTISMEFADPWRNPLRASGSMSLLSRYRTRRGAIVK